MYVILKDSKFDNEKFDSNTLNITYNTSDLKNIIINHLKRLTESNPEDFDVLSLETEWLMLKKFYKNYLSPSEYEHFLKQMRFITKLNLSYVRDKKEKKDMIR